MNVEVSIDKKRITVKNIGNNFLIKHGLNNICGTNSAIIIDTLFDFVLEKSKDAIVIILDKVPNSITIPFNEGHVVLYPGDISDEVECLCIK